MNRPRVGQTPLDRAPLDPLVEAPQDQAPLVEARLVQASDLSAVSRVWNSAVSELSEQRGGPQLLSDAGAAADGARQSVELYLGDDRRLAGVGTLGAAVVGLVLASQRSAAEPAKLDVIYVEPDARKLGVGEAMISLALGWASAHGCSGVDAPALPGNRAAKAFFETHRFTARLLVMHRSSG